MQKAQRDHSRRIIQDMRTHAKAALGHGITARQVLEAQKGALPPNLRLALEAVVARDERGPQVGRMEAIYHQYRTHIELFVIYVQEAHPTDGWQTDSNVAEGIVFRQHQSYEERESVAATCHLDLRLSLLVLIEEMDNAMDEAYGAAPERLYLIGVDGRVAYRGGAGPYFFNLDEWERAIAASVSSATV